LSGAVPAGPGLADPALPDAIKAGTSGIGLVAARRAVRVSGPRRRLDQPVIIEVEPRENIAAGQFGWGLGPWAPPGSVRRVSSSGHPLNGSDETSVDGDDAVAGILTAAAGRSLVVAVRDAHRDQRTLALIHALLAARPDLVLVEMGLPFWHPPEGTSYLATYGASRASAHAAAELLGLGVTATPREDT
jgi:beta-N-acetylhexosaminidase